MEVSRQPEPDGAQRGRGRPRNPEVERAVRLAVWEALGSVGYDRLTMDEVARLAGCSKPALYRRWPGKQPMVLEALQGFIDDTMRTRPVRHGAPLESLVDWVAGLVIFLSGSGRGALLALSQARSTEPELAAALDKIVDDDRPKFAQALRAAWGQDTPDAAIDRAIDALLGAVFWRVALRGGTMSEAEVQALCEDVLRMGA
ncbi:TetR/AcrR family transcriptional regulator [Caulobacter soli]|uniref:TetR/AcrR family transcriptional regulator n=1 Tax=Caulobacter soli TaxID=2708539 RepID=UPI0013EB28E4|nr:TetR/AcrR family transcriptional regulator [Caulobacter soli]